MLAESAVQIFSSLAGAALYYGNFIQAPDVDIRNPFSIRIEISPDLFCEWKKERRRCNDIRRHYGLRLLAETTTTTTTVGET